MFPVSDRLLAWVSDGGRVFDQVQFVPSVERSSRNAVSQRELSFQDSRIRVPESTCAASSLGASGVGAGIGALGANTSHSASWVCPAPLLAVMFSR